MREKPKPQNKAVHSVAELPLPLPPSQTDSGAKEARGRVGPRQREGEKVEGRGAELFYCQRFRVNVLTCTTRPYTMHFLVLTRETSVSTSALYSVHTCSLHCSSPPLPPSSADAASEGGRKKEEEEEEVERDNPTHGRTRGDQEEGF